MILMKYVENPLKMRIFELFREKYSRQAARLVPLFGHQDSTSRFAAVYAVS